MKDYDELWRGANYSIIAHTVKANIKKGFEASTTRLVASNMTFNALILGNRTRHMLDICHYSFIFLIDNKEDQYHGNCKLI